MTAAPRAAQRVGERPDRRCRRGAARTRSPAASGSSRPSVVPRRAATGRRRRRCPPSARTAGGRLPDRGPAEVARVHAESAQRASSTTRAAFALVTTIRVAGAGPATRRVEGAAGAAPDGSRSPARGRPPRRRPRARASSASACAGRPRRPATRGRVAQRDDPAARAARRAPGARSTGARAADPGDRARRRSRRPAAGDPRPLGAGDERPAVRRRRRPIDADRRPAAAAGPVEQRALRLDGDARRRIVEQPDGRDRPRRRRRAPGGRASPGRARTGPASAGRMSSMRSARPRRVRPATARTSASLSPRSSLARRVSTLPWSGWMPRSGRTARRNATRRGLSVPTRAPVGSVASVVPRTRQTSASRGSSRGG